MQLLDVGVSSDYGRIDVGRLDLDAVDVDLVEGLYEDVMTMSEIAREHGRESGADKLQRLADRIAAKRGPRRGDLERPARGLEALMAALERLQERSVKVYAVVGLLDFNGDLLDGPNWALHAERLYRERRAGFGHTIIRRNLGVLSYQTKSGPLPALPVEIVMGHKGAARPAAVRRRDSEGACAANSRSAGGRPAPDAPAARSHREQKACRIRPLE